MRYIGQDADEKRLDAIEMSSAPSRDDIRFMLDLSRSLLKQHDGYTDMLFRLAEDDTGTCEECGQVASLDEYMVLDSVWAEAGIPNGVLHRTCLEKRIGRPLRRDDFPDMPCNSVWAETGEVGS